jgi:hypothetical protein
MTEYDELAQNLYQFGGKTVIAVASTTMQVNVLLARGFLMRGPICRKKGNLVQTFLSSFDGDEWITGIGWGYGLCQGTWQEHSWLLLQDGTIVDLSGKEFEKYFGVLLQDEEAEAWCDGKWDSWADAQTKQAKQRWHAKRGGSPQG